MTNHDIISRARDVAASIVRNNMTATMNDWLVYGMALDYGKSNTRGGVCYNRWIKSNGLGDVPSNLRSYARIVAYNWDNVEPYTRIGQPFHGVNDITKLCSLAYKLNKKDKSDSTINNDHVVYTGVNPTVVAKAIDDIALAAATMPSNTIYGSALMRALDRLSNAVINSYLDKAT